MHHPTRSAWFRCGSLAVLMGILLTPVAAVAAPVPFRPTPQLTQAETRHPLVGQWFSPTALAGEPLTFIFDEDGTLYFIITLPRGRMVAQEFGYEFPTDSAADEGAIAIDLTLPDGNLVPTLAEISPEGELRFQIEGTGPGMPRPSSFNENVARFERVSDSSELPPPLLEANVLDALFDISRAQRTHYLEFRRFADSTDPLNSDPVPLDSDHYRIELSFPEDPSQSVRITATAKRDDLHSFTSGVFMVPNERGLSVSMVGICRSDEPQTMAPEMPIPPVTSVGTVACAPGSHLMER